MARGHTRLLTEIERDALDSQAARSDTLRELIARGGAAGSTELRDWAALELRGYVGTDVELPWRRTGAFVVFATVIAAAVAVAQWQGWF